jgi:hypothetical protein
MGTTPATASPEAIDRPHPVPPFGYRLEHRLGGIVSVVGHAPDYPAAAALLATLAGDPRVAGRGGQLRIVEEAFGTTVAVRLLGDPAASEP